MTNSSSKFKAVFNDTQWSDAFYRFLQVIFHLYPEDKFHQLIKEETAAKSTDEEIYKSIQNRLPFIKPFFSELTYALPALKKQKKEIIRQTLGLLGGVSHINGYAEIGSTGRYISQLRKQVKVHNPIYLINDFAPANSPADIMERGQLRKLGTFIDLNNYEPISQLIEDNSIDMLTCYIGLHHCPPQKLDNFVASIHRVIRTDGSFIIRDHDVKTPEMATFVSLVHTVFNVGLNETWEFEQRDSKNFRPADEWANIIEKAGFKDVGKRMLQDKDPSDNALILFKKL
jgi:SAM-dependent methyltransferase